MKNLKHKIWLFLIGAEEVVKGFPVIRDKKQPSLCYVITPWYEEIFFGPYSTLAFRDETHPDRIKFWKKQVEKYKDYKIVNGKFQKVL